MPVLKSYKELKLLLKKKRFFYSRKHRFILSTLSTINWHICLTFLTLSNTRIPKIIH